MLPDKNIAEMYIWFIVVTHEKEVDVRSLVNWYIGCHWLAMRNMIVDMKGFFFGLGNVCNVNKHKR